MSPKKQGAIKDIFYVDGGFKQNATTETFTYNNQEYTTHQITIKSNIAKNIIALFMIVKDNENEELPPHL